MARDFTSISKLSRREGVALHPKAVKTLTKRNYPPGDHGMDRRAKMSNYAIQLREKQKVKRMYGLLEKQFKKCVEKAEKMQGVSGENLLMLLERRLDNICYRLGFAPSTQAARQLVSHAHVRLNGKKVNVPSQLVNIGDEISIKDKSLNNNYFVQIKQDILKDKKNQVSWLSLDTKKFVGKVTSLPLREDIDQDIKEQLIIEYYSR